MTNNITYNHLSNRREYKVILINSKRIKVIIASAILFVTILAAGLLTNSSTDKVNAKSSSYKYYKSVQIQQGDTVWSIAEDYITPEYAGVQEYVNEILEFNNMINDKIYVGDYIVIPYYKH